LNPNLPFDLARRRTARQRTCPSWRERFPNRREKGSRCQPT
jgi:hypothetical protein